MRDESVVGFEVSEHFETGDSSETEDRVAEFLEVDERSSCEKLIPEGLVDIGMELEDRFCFEV